MLNNGSFDYEDVLFTIKQFYNQFDIHGDLEEKLIEIIQWSYANVDLWDSVCGIGEAPFSVPKGKFVKITEHLLNDGLLELFYMYFYKYYRISFMNDIT